MLNSYQDCLKSTEGDAKKASIIWNAIKNGDAYDAYNPPQPSQYAPPQQAPDFDIDGAIERIALQLDSKVNGVLNNYKHELTDEMRVHLDALNSRIGQYGSLIRKFTSESKDKNGGNGRGSVKDFAVCKTCLLGFEKDEFLSFNGKCPKCGNQLLIRKGVSGKSLHEDGDEGVWLGLLAGGVGATGVVLAIQNWDKITKFFNEFFTDLSISTRSFSRSRHIPRYSPRNRPQIMQKKVIQVNAPPAPVHAKEVLPMGSTNKSGFENTEDVEDEMRIHEPEKGAMFPYSE